MAPLPRPPSPPLVLVVCSADGLLHAFDGPWRIETARDTAQGLACARTRSPSLVVCDDLALVRAIRADIRIDTAPVLFVLASGGDVDAEIRALASGADAVLPWPAAPERVRAWARRLIETRRALRERWSRRAALIHDAGDSPEVAFLDRVRLSAEAGMGTPGFSTSDLAYALHMGTRQFTRRLKALTGETPSALVRRLRMSRAAALLGAGASVKQAARAVGYTSRSQFRNAFQAAHGMLPSAYAERPPLAALPSPGGSARAPSRPDT